MARFHGRVGFVKFVERVPGIDVEDPVERDYFGDTTRISKRWESAQQVNPNLTVNNQISIVADQYARDNLFAIRYVSWMGSNWQVTTAEVQHPRIILTIGGVYNGPTPGSSDGTGESAGCGCNG